MPEVTDLAAPTVEIELPSGRKYRIGELSLDDIINLVVKFPEMKAFVDGKKLVDLTPQRLFEMGPEVAATIIALGLGYREDGAAEAIRKWGGDTQLRLLNAVIKQSFPEGIGPFAAAVRSISNSFVLSVVRAKNSETEDSETHSTEPLSAQLQMDEASKQRYAPRPGNSRSGPKPQNASASAA